MSVERSQKKISSNETYYDNRFLCFPCKRICALNLFGAENVEEFSKWHAAILTWGLHTYSRQYLHDANLTFIQGRTMIGYADTVEVEVDIFKNIPHADIDPESNIHVCE